MYLVHVLFNNYSENYQKAMCGLVIFPKTEEFPQISSSCGSSPNLTSPESYLKILNATGGKVPPIMPVSSQLRMWAA